MGSDGQIGGGWVRVVGYGGGWVEMVMGGSVVVGGSVGDGRISGGADLCFDLFLFLFLFFCFGGFDLMVDLVAIVG